MDNLYDILGISKEAASDEKELKKAYRKKSLENHPDRVASKSKEEQDAAADRMQDINKAYEILSDPHKKEIYDMTGSVESAERGDAGGFGEFGGGFGGFGGFDMSDIFGDIFGHGSRSNSRSGGYRYAQPGTDLQIRIRLTLDELLSGTMREHKIRYKRDVRCPVCHGTGGDTKICPHCNGTGEERIVRNSGFAQISQTKICSHCKGTGQVVTKSCERCGGTGFEKKETEKTIIFPDGIQDGQYIVYENEGSESKSPSGATGNLIVIAQFDYDKSRFTIDNADVIEKVRINYEDCILGGKISHVLSGGKEISLTVPPLTVPGKRFMLRGKGLKLSYGRGQLTTGNYYIEVVYGLPDEVSDKERTALEKIRKNRKTAEEK